MSVLGQTLPIRTVWTMSGLPLVATELRTSRVGSFGPDRHPGRVGPAAKIDPLMAAFNAIAWMATNPALQVDLRWHSDSRRQRPAQPLD